MKILIVDDDDLVRRSLGRAFQLKGHEVEMVESGERAIEAWPQFNPDIVLLDVLMPEISGPDVLNSVEKGKSRVVLMSAYKGEYNSETAIELGAHDFLLKPFDNILEVVETVVANHGQEC